MVKFNSKRLLAVVVASTMVFGSSLTAFAANVPTDGTAGEVTGAGTAEYEGNMPSYPAPSITLPTVSTGQFNYIADPNGLIARSNSAKYSSATWSGQGVYFQTETGKYTDTSAPLEITNNSAYSLDIAVELKQTDTSKKNVKFSTDKTFANSADKELYLALTDGTNTVAISEDSTAVTPAVMNITVNGKPSNFEFKYASNAYSIALKDNASGWNKSSVAVNGALNLASDWTSGDGDAAIVFPPVTVTYDVTMGAVPVFITNGGNKVVTLTHKGAGVTITDIKFGATAVPSSMYDATAIDASKAAKITLKPAFTSFAYDKVPADGMVFTVTYSDKHVETFTVVK